MKEESKIERFFLYEMVEMPSMLCYYGMSYKQC